MSTRRCLAAVVLVTLAVRLALVFATPHYAPATDSADYDHSAVSLVEHGRFPASELTLSGGPTAFRPPLFPLALSAAYRLAGTGSASQRWQAGRLLEAMLGALAVGLLFLIALELWGRARAIVVGGLAAAYPPLILIGSSLMVEPLFVALELGAVLAALRSRRGGGPAPALAAGVLTGLAALTRGNGIVLCLPLCLLAAAPGPARLRLRRAAVVLGATALTVLPWAIRDLAVFGQPVALSTETGYALAGTYNGAAQHDGRYPTLWIPPAAQVVDAVRRHPGANEAQVSAALSSGAVRYVERHPGSVLRTAGWTALRLLDLPGPGLERVAARGEAYPVWLAVVSVYAFWVMAGLGLLGLLRGAARRGPPSLWWCPAVLVLSTLFILGTTRYRSPADPFLLLLAAGAFTGLEFRPRAGRASATVAPRAMATIRTR
jgi:4-amino-4-deoxy-L-arabinose transferase-like glycosyltransferase